MIIYKKVKSTDNELAHTKVYFDDEYMGYIIKDYSNININHWIFTSENKRISYFVDKTRRDIIYTLEKIYQKKLVNLKLHFGLKEENYIIKN